MKLSRERQTELIDAAICGDEDAFAELYREYSPRLKLLIANYVREDPDMAEDILQNVFLQIHKKLHMFEGDADFGTWCHRVAVNEALQYRRSRQSKRYRATTSFEELVVGEEGEEVAFDPGYEAKELDLVGDVDKMRACVEGLPRYMREALSLRLKGYNLQETADELGVSVGAGKSYLNRGTKLLTRKMLRKGQTVDTLNVMDLPETEKANVYQPARAGRKCKCGCGTDIPMKGWPFAKGHGSRQIKKKHTPPPPPPVRREPEITEGFTVKLTEAEINRLLLALPVSAKLTAVLAFVRG